MDSTATDNTDLRGNASKPQPSILTLNNDILLLICTTLATEQAFQQPRPPIRDPSPLKNFSTTCKRIRALASPLIFRNIKLGGNGWTGNDIQLAIPQMLACQAIQRHTKRLSVDSFNGVCGNDRQNTLVGLLQSMTKLERLDLSALSGSDEDLYFVKRAFAESPALTFESVRALATRCRMDWIVEKFPNLRSLDVQAANAMNESPIEAIRQVPGLQHLECKAYWTPELLKEVYQAAPGLKTLTMQSSRPQYSKPVFDFVPTLAQFEDLRRLVLAPIGYLNAGFTAPRCGNAYRGPNGDKVRQRVRKDRQRLSGLVAEAAFGKCKGLEELWIGQEGRECKATCVRGGDGSAKEIQWSMGQWEGPAGRL